MKAVPRNAVTRPLGAAALLLSCAFAPSAAFADTTLCTTIGALPATINASGTYCLIAPLVTAEGTAPNIDIKANNVVLDCNENQITFTGESGGVGLRITNRSDIVVKNCRFNGFNTGIDVLSGHRVTLRNNTANLSRSSGIRVTGTENLVEGNVVTNTPGANSIRVTAFADSSSVVANNTVRLNNPSSAVATGIRVGGAGRVFLRDNVVREVGTASNSVGASIWVESDAALVPSPAVVRDGANFKGGATNNYSVQSSPTTAKSVCDVASIGYTGSPTPGCL